MGTERDAVGELVGLIRAGVATTVELAARLQQEALRVAEGIVAQVPAAQEAGRRAAEAAAAQAREGLDGLQAELREHLRGWEETLRSTAAGMGLATKADLDALRARVDALAARVDVMARRTRPPRGSRPR